MLKFSNFRAILNFVCMLLKEQAFLLIDFNCWFFRDEKPIDREMSASLIVSRLMGDPKVKNLHGIAHG